MAGLLRLLISCPACSYCAAGSQRVLLATSLDRVGLQQIVARYLPDLMLLEQSLPVTASQMTPQAVMADQTAQSGLQAVVW